MKFLNISLKKIFASLLCGGVVACTSVASPPDGQGQPSISSVSPPHFSTEEWSVIRSFSPERLPSPPPDPTNRFADNPAASRLGQKLFFETRFSGKLTSGDNNGEPTTLGRKGETGKISCAGCHLPNQGFSDFRSPSTQISLAASWGKRRAPSILDIAHSPLIMWDGRIDSLHSQIMAAVEDPVEMNSGRLLFAYQIAELYKEEYEDLFGPLPNFSDTKRFPPLAATDVGCKYQDGVSSKPCNGPQRGGPGDQAEYDGLAPSDKDAVTGVVMNAGKAIAAYERHLTCGSSRFDTWVHGKSDALTETEQRGLKIFVSRGQCANCHTGPFFTDFKFHNVGLVPSMVASAFHDFDDQGALEGFQKLSQSPLNSRGKFSDGINPALKDAEEQLKLRSDELTGSFRTPKLRCISSNPSYMHTGQFKSLSSVVGHFSKGGSPMGYPGKNELSQVNLTAEERNDLIAFLKSLDGPGPDKALRNPQPTALLN